MYFRPAIFALCVALLLVSGVVGCRKPEFREPAASPTPLSPDTIASIHWAGKHQLDLNGDAYCLSRVWSLPETARLQSQTFDRLATNAWNWLLGKGAAAQIPAAVLRPLFDELTLQESYLEMRAASNTPPSFVLATRVSARFAGIWETNLAIAAGLLSGVPAVPSPALHGWTIQRTNPPNRIALTRVGDWTVLSVGPAQNALADDIAERIHNQGVPFVSSGTNLWFEAHLDLARLTGAFPAFNVSSNFNKFNLAISGDGANVITRAKLELNKPLPATLEPWQLPLDLMHEPLTGFTAARGLEPLLGGCSWWHELPLGAAPDQLFIWSLAGSPYQIYLAAPLPDTAKQVSGLADWLIQKSNPWLAARGYIAFDRAPDGNGVSWGNLPDIKPFIKFAGSGSNGWLYAGLYPDDPTNAAPAPAGMIQYLLHHTNFLYYDWEVTGPRLQPFLTLGQTARTVSRRPQMSQDSASLNWLAGLIPRLDSATTLIDRTGPAELTFYRRSTLGLTALELHLLADWLESPQFPGSLHSSTASPDNR
jgi:hypothetical protein